MSKLKAREQVIALRERYLAPCQAACPVHTDAREYVMLSGEAQFEAAFLAARGPNPFAAVCGRACSAPCEDVCTRREFDGTVRIRQLKRFLTDRYEVIPLAELRAALTGLRVAVVGAGPAGMAAAHDLSLLGHTVTVYEAAPEPGGMALLGVPRFRLSHAAIERDIEPIRAAGVAVRTGVRIGQDLSLEELRAAHEAVLIATGTMQLNTLDVPGADLPGVVQALPFLEEANLGGRPPCGDRVAVIGGGYTAMDAARTAVRLGAREVTVLYRRTRSETEVHDDELNETVHEGVRIEYLVSPLHVTAGDDGRAAGVSCIRNRLGEPDSSGRPRPVPIPGTEFAHAADMVILALGQSPDAVGVDTAQGNLLRDVDAGTWMTGMPGVFSGGDFVSGASTIIEAVASGREAAASIHRFLNRTYAPTANWPEPPAAWTLRAHNGAQPLGTVSRRGGDAEPLSLDREVEATLTRTEAMSEGLRCLACGLLPTVILDACTACQACVLVCPADAIDRVALDDDGAETGITGHRDALAYQVRAEACILCGRCIGACPTGAIVVARPH